MTEVFRPPPIRSREEWNALPSASSTPHIPCRIVVHHSWNPTTRDWSGAETIRAIQQYHMRTNGWGDIAYHYLIGPDGSAWAGRDPKTVGAHCGGTPPAGVGRTFGNTGSIGICVIGNYDRERPSLEAVTALASMVVWLQDTFRMPPLDVFGHCEAWTKAPKSCPGKNLFAEMFGPDRWTKIRW